MTTETRIKNKKEEREFMDAIYWAGVLIWAGLVFTVESLGYLPQIGEADAWSWAFFGAGLYGTLGNLYRLASANWSNPMAWDYIWSGFWLLVGLGALITSDIFWPVVLVLAGMTILGNTLLRRD